MHQITDGNISFFEIERIIEVKDAIQCIGNKFIELNDWDFDNFEIFLDVVGQFKITTEKFSLSQASISQIIPEIDALVDDLEPKLSKSEVEIEIDLIQNLSSKLNRVVNLESYKNDPEFMAATILDPRYKNLYANEQQMETFLTEF